MPCLHLGPNKTFSHDVTAAKVVFQNNEITAMLVFQVNPAGVDHELFYYVNAFFCSSKLRRRWPREWKRSLSSFRYFSNLVPDLSPQASSLKDLGTRLSRQIFSQICPSLKWPFKFLWKKIHLQTRKALNVSTREISVIVRCEIISWFAWLSATKVIGGSPGGHPIKFYTRRFGPEFNRPLTLSVVSFSAIFNYVNVFSLFWNTWL